MISELQRQLAELDSNSSHSEEQDEQSVSRPPRRQNPFNRELPPTIQSHSQAPLRPAPPPPITPIIRDTLVYPISKDKELDFPQRPQSDDDFSFITVHEYLGKAWEEVIKSRQEAKAKTEQPLILL